MTDIQQMLMAQEGTGPMAHGRYFPYQDSVGRWTLGFGRNITDNGISHDEALMLLNGDICDALDAVKQCCSCYDTLSRPRQLVMLSLSYNLGQDRLSGFVRFLGALHRGAWEECADELLDSLAARQCPLRYQQLAAMMRENVSTWI